MAMRLLLAATLLLLVGTASLASAHYIIQEDTPAGKLCFLNEEIILDGLRNQDPGEVVVGVFTTGCDVD
jgi:hypothetical protein